MAKELKKLNPEARSFDANGKTYYIESSLSIARFHQYQIYEKEAGFSLTFKTLVDELKAVYELLNTMKVADASVRINNVLVGTARLQEKESVLLKICALFMNLEDEDRGEINDDMISAKIEDWKNEYEVEGFFSRALNTVNGFFKHYAEMHQIISAIGKQNGETD